MTTTTHLSSLIPVPSGVLQVSRLPHDNQASDWEHGSSQLTCPVRFSLIIPTYNESGNIEKLIQQLSAILDPILPNDYELIVVDDNSRDRTWELAANLMADYSCLRVMRRQGEQGLSTAVIRGWQVAQGEVLGVIDGDLQHPPEILPKLLAAIENRADLAVASRHVEGGGVSSWSLVRRFLSRGAQMLGIILLPRVVSSVSDPMSGYFVLRRQAIAGKILSPVGYKILIEVLGRGEINRIVEVGYVFQEREEGQSKVTWRQYTDYLHHLLRLRLSTGRLGWLSQRLDFPIGRFLRFAFVGLSGLVVDMGALFILHGVMGWGLTRSAIVAAELAILNNFVWNDLWTFKDFSQRQRGKRKLIKRLLKFNLVCLMGVILKVLLLNVLFNGLHINPYLANFLAIAVVTLWNFWLNLKLSWRVTEVTEEV
ncbi:glycosyltransferase family 2 protein [Kovacikia minuta CCNUW1]|uniref:glycosyltransferase n=1 Tax=Kovacikia minuta TaxID=2931930 RepID=UPI001CCF0E4D|nr:glycosyltransferase [Kovacikia minuta]UBF29409.1 glycosyltransferase family 2 protein [Kovacikia minuta CCNUW1]